mmetsp:Transcript_82389/g.191344  ORF Transcript_82389/g.191344 Transcript_82389/m.191344 type:complete len:248 (-) Transcript_82389:123-866(-)
MANPRTVLMWPVNDSFSVPLARSQILMSLSLPEEANHSLVGSTATHRTQPSWPESTRMSFQGGCHTGLGTSGRSRGGLICTTCEGSVGAAADAGTTGPGAGLVRAAPRAFPSATLVSMSIRVIADGRASRVASSAAPAQSEGRGAMPSSVAWSGTSRTCSYSSCIFMRNRISVAAASSGRRISWLPMNMSCARFNDLLTAIVTGTRSRAPRTSSPPAEVVPLATELVPFAVAAELVPFVSSIPGMTV